MVSRADPDVTLVKEHNKGSVRLLVIYKGARESLFVLFNRRNVEISWGRLCLTLRTKYRKANIAYKYAAIYNDRFTSDVTEGRSLADMIDYLEKENPIVQIPEDFIFSSRLTLLLRGMGNAFGLRIKLSSMWEDYARELLAKQSSNTSSNTSNNTTTSSSSSRSSSNGSGAENSNKMRRGS